MTAKKAKKRSAAAGAAPAKAASAKKVNVLVNGSATGTIPDSGTVGQAASEIANNHGLRAFTIKVDGIKVETHQANRSLKGANSIELVAKESRG